MIAPHDGDEFCIVGNGKKIHVRLAGPMETTRKRNPLCGVAKGRRWRVAFVSTVTPERANEAITDGSFSLCQGCGAHTHTTEN